MATQIIVKGAATQKLPSTVLLYQHDTDDLVNFVTWKAWRYGCLFFSCGSVRCLIYGERSPAIYGTQKLPWQRKQQ